MDLSKESMTTIHIIASGDTGSRWTGQRPSIGVNDSWKWGYPTDYLLLLNAPQEFQQSRFNIIKDSRPKKVLTHLPESWEKHLSNVELLPPVQRWGTSSKISKNCLYHSQTSPFVAISLAYTWGYDQIVLWGVDFINHHRYGKDQRDFLSEYSKYKTFFKALQLKGVRVSIGSNGTAFDNILSVWEAEKSFA